MAHIAFATREVWPFVPGGGIGRYVWTVAGLLAREHDVTVVTSSRHGATADRMPPGVALVAVDEPDAVSPPHVAWADEWSARLHRAVAELRPDVVEFPDYLGEGFATVQARRAGDPALRKTLVAIRLQGAAEMYAALNSAPIWAGDGVVWGIERFALRHADLIVTAGGDVLERTTAFYGELPPAVELPLPLVPEPVEPVAPRRTGPLRLLFLNRCMPLKGPAELIQAVRSRPDRDLRLTLVGGDTDLAPGGGSMRAHLARLAAGDPRIGFVDRVPHDEVNALIAAHHVVVVPSRWETFSYVVREALAAHRPVLATPVGAIPEVVVPGRSGWLASATSPEALAQALDEIDLAAALRLIDAGVATALDAERAVNRSQPEAYARLAASPGTGDLDGSPEVRVVLSVTDADLWDDEHRAALERTRASLAAQHGCDVAVTEEREEVDRVAAYRRGAREGDEPYVALVPATCSLAPDALARLAVALERQPAFDYATCRAAGQPLPYGAPLGGTTARASGADVGGSVVVVRRAVLERTAAGAVVERDLVDGLEGVVSQDALVEGFPLRPVTDHAPANGGGPDLDAARTAFGAIWQSAVAMDVPAEIPVDAQLDGFVTALVGERPVVEVRAPDAAARLADAHQDGAAIVVRGGVPDAGAMELLAAIAAERPVALVVANRLRRPGAEGAALHDDAREALAGLPDAVWLSQHLAEGSLLVREHGGERLGGTVTGAAAVEPAYAEHWLVCSGFDPSETDAAAAALAVSAAPVPTRELMDLRRANAELERHNRDLASGLLGRHDAAAASAVAKLDERTREAETRAWILEQEKLAAEARAAQVERWHDAGRYHAVDHAVSLVKRVPGVNVAARGARRVVRALRPRQAT